MVRPNFIPRTLRGVGGVRLFDIPGVIYPKEMLIPKVGYNRKNGLPYREIPGWGLSTREAADLLGCTPASARTWLHRRKVPYRLVSDDGLNTRIFWRKDKVLALAKARLPIYHHCPPSLISSAEALKILGIGRSTLHRYQERGLLSATLVRSPSNKGLRKCCYFRRAEVENLAHLVTELRSKEAELSHLWRCNPPIHPPSSADSRDPSLPPTHKRCKKKSN